MLKRARPELPDGCVSDLSFDALRAGELSAGARQKIADHVARCARCRERQQALDGSFVEAEARLPAFVPRTSAKPPDAPKLAARVHRQERRALSPYALALAACALLALVPWAALERDGDPATRTKGGPSLSIYVKRGDDVFTWAPGDVVVAGDALRFAATPRGYPHIAILSRRADGETSLYHPQAAHSAAIDAAASRVALDGAIELDEVVQDERLFAVFCRAPFATHELAAELTSRGTLAARPGCEIAVLLLPKRRNP